MDTFPRKTLMFRCFVLQDYHGFKNISNFNNALGKRHWDHLQSTAHMLTLRTTDLANEPTSHFLKLSAP